jgi:tripartite-type tricarboxylate transporter receptor subunit TctC
MGYARFAALVGPALIGPALIAICAAAAAWGQAFPSKPLRLITPFPPGGSADIIARLAAQGLSEVLGQPAVVENRAGAGGVTGSEYAAKQPPDGHTLVLITGAYPVYPAMLKAMPFDPLKDIGMVSMLTSYPFVISVVPDSPFKTVADLIARAKANPGKLNYPSSGIGTVHHLSGELFNALAGTYMVHVPYRGGTAPLMETLAGRVDVLFEAMTLSIGQIQAGKLRALAVTSRERWKALPDTPTVQETLPGYEVNSFIGLGVTGGTPAAIVERLNAAVRKALETPETRRRFVELGGEPAASSPEEMRSFITSEIEKWKKVVAARNIEKQ